MRVVVERFHHAGTLRFQLTGPVGVITISRPRQHNALTRQMWVTIGEWVANLPSKSRILVLRGAGNEFTAGSDIKEFATLSPDEANQAFEMMESTIQRIEDLSIPTIACISGPTFGAGFVLAMACDLRIGTENATFGMPVGKLGITLQTPFLHRLKETIGASRTKDLVYTARTYGAREALDIGILNYLASGETIDADTMALCRSILSQSPASLLAVKENMRHTLSGLDADARMWVDRIDFVEGVRAFTEKRRVQF